MGDLLGKFIFFPITTGILIGIAFVIFGPQGLYENIKTNQKLIDQVVMQAYSQDFIFKEKRLMETYEIHLKELVTNGVIK